AFGLLFFAERLDLKFGAQAEHGGLIRCGWRDRLDRVNFSLEDLRQRGVHFAHGDVTAKVLQACDAMLAHATGHNSPEMAEIGRDIEAQPVEADPSADPDADGRDLVLSQLTLIGPAHPHTDSVRPALAVDAEHRQRINHPAFKSSDEGSNITDPAAYVEHDVDDSLTRTVVGELASTASAVDGKSVWVDQILPSSAGARSV